jgi:alpha-ribazole phosphatase
VRLDLVRHLPAHVAPGTCYGRSDVACAHADPAALATYRARLASAQVISSPARRCADLARRLASDPRLDPRLLEIDFGRWELQAFDAIDRAAIDAWAAAPWDFVPPDGESASQMARRVVAALDDILRLDALHVVVVAHGGPLRVMLGTLLRAPRAHWLGLAFEPGDVVSLDLDDADRGFARMSLKPAGG